MGDIDRALATGDFSDLKPDEIEVIAKDMIVTTETYVPDLGIDKRLGVITAECVFGMNVFKDIFSGLTDFFGGRSRSTQNSLKDARVLCMSELKREALMLGADAVVGVDLDYSEFSGKDKSMLFLVASGTAVTLKK
ncbi:MAG: YbjQ family protein [Alphaproteobacteria bacterium]|nr:YbjQ family protein [Alphaproteobacteria bacterium]